MWIEGEDLGGPGSDGIRIIVAEPGLCLDIVLEEGDTVRRRTPCVMCFAPGTKVVRICVGASSNNVEDGADWAKSSDPRAGSADRDPHGPAMAALSPREVEVLSHLSTGEANKQIARRMNISDETVRGHIKSIFRKTGMENRTQAALWAVLTHVRKAHRARRKQTSEPSRTSSNSDP